MKSLRYLYIFTLLFFTVLFHSICLTLAVAEQYVTGGAVDPYEVTLFSSNNYSKPMASVRMPPGVRMLKIPQINGQPLSISVGSKVGVILFPDIDYSSRKKVPSDHDWSGHDRDWKLVPYFMFYSSTPTIDYSVYQHQTNFDRCSMIVHRTDVKDILGVFLHSDEWGQFLPLPEKPSEIGITYSKIVSGSHFKIEFVGGGRHAAFSLIGGEPPSLGDLDVTIKSSTGSTVRLPDPNKQSITYDLHAYGIQQIASIQFLYKGPIKAQAYDLPQHVKSTMPEQDRKHLTAPEASDTPKSAAIGTAVTTPAAKQVTRIPPPAPPAAPATTTPAPTKVVRVPPPASVPPPTTVARTAAPAAVTPAAPAVPDVSGQWKSSVNRVYNIKQTNNRFQWTVVNDTEVGEGVVSEKDIYASWKGKMGPGSINGKITSVDSKGKATQILWNNGVWFNR